MMFEKATKLKLRFQTTKGSLSVEDLWDLSLRDLDSMAKSVNKLLREEDEESFIPGTSSKSATHNSLRLDLLKHIIGVKVQEQETRKNRAKAMDDLHRLKELASVKQNEQLASQSLEEILKKIQELEAAV